MARRDGKIIDQRDMKDGDGNVVKVKIHMTTDGGQTKFFATCPAVPLLKTEKTATVDETITLAREAIGKVQAITWQRKLRVKLSSCKPESYAFPRVKEPNEIVDIDYELQLQVEEFEVGLSGNKPVYRTRERGGRWVGGKRVTDYSRISEGDPAEISSWYGNMTKATAAMIDDTPENRRSLALILDLLANLEKRLKEFLGPERLMETLSLVASGRPLALAGPIETKKGRK